MHIFALPISVLVTTAGNGQNSLEKSRRTAEKSLKKSVFLFPDKVYINCKLHGTPGPRAGRNRAQTNRRGCRQCSGKEDSWLIWEPASCLETMMERNEICKCFLCKHMLANNFLTSDFLCHSRYLLPRLELSKSFTSMFKCCAISKNCSTDGWDYYSLPWNYRFVFDGKNQNIATLITPSSLFSKTR